MTGALCLYEQQKSLIKQHERPACAMCFAELPRLGEHVERLRDVIRFGYRSGFNTLSDQDRLQMAWVVVCGRVMAERAQVSGYEDGVVKIAVQERAWLEEMRGMSSHLEGELSRVAGLKVSKLHFIVKR